ncbi:Calmodulin-regulated spectrin-associated protein 1 [Chytridiales sp. JEL 0842]|nr:Calmodulin-regulated spectrin-associated protein 1 [Chytridiales sp. JEL 0842]
MSSQESFQTHPLPPSLAWIADTLDQPSMKQEDLIDGFALVQTLSILSPSSVDLAWYTTDEALNCNNLISQNYRILHNGLKKLGIDVDEDTLKEAVTGSSVDPCIKIAAAISQWRTRNSQSFSPTTSIAANAPASAQSASQITLVNEEESVKSVSPSPSTTDMINHESIYEPSEMSLITNIRWLLRIISNADAKKLNFSPECIEQAKEMEASLKTTIVPAGPIIPALTYGAVYEIASREICNRPTASIKVDGLLPPPNQPKDETDTNWISLKGGFLDTLMEHRYMDFKASFKDCVKDMIADRTPFFESIHSNIIEALMSSSMASVKVEDVTSFLQTSFPKLAKKSIYPYDLEDALIIWSNWCAQSLLRNIEESQGPKPYFLSNWTPIEDLTELRDGRGLCAIALYHSFATFRADQVQPRSKSTKGEAKLNLNQRITNLLIFESACEHAGITTPPWTPEELAGVTGNPENNEDLSAGASGFRIPVVSYLCDLFKAVIRKDGLRVQESPKFKPKVQVGSENQEASTKKSDTLQKPLVAQLGPQPASTTKKVNPSPPIKPTVDFSIPMSLIEALAPSAESRPDSTPQSVIEVNRFEYSRTTEVTKVVDDLSPLPILSKSQPAVRKEFKELLPTKEEKSRIETPPRLPEAAEPSSLVLPPSDEEPKIEPKADLNEVDLSHVVAVDKDQVEEKKVEEPGLKPMLENVGSLKAVGNESSSPTEDLLSRIAKKETQMKKALQAIQTVKAPIPSTLAPPVQSTLPKPTVERKSSLSSGVKQTGTAPKKVTIKTETKSPATVNEQSKQSVTTKKKSHFQQQSTPQPKPSSKKKDEAKPSTPAHPPNASLTATHPETITATTTPNVAFPTVELRQAKESPAWGLSNTVNLPKSGRQPVVETNEGSPARDRRRKLRTMVVSKTSAVKLETQEDVVRERLEAGSNGGGEVATTSLAVVEQSAIGKVEAVTPVAELVDNVVTTNTFALKPGAVQAFEDPEATNGTTIAATDIINDAEGTARLDTVPTLPNLSQHATPHLLSQSPPSVQAVTLTKSTKSPIRFPALALKREEIGGRRVEPRRVKIDLSDGSVVAALVPHLPLDTPAINPVDGGRYADDTDSDEEERQNEPPRWRGKPKAKLTVERKVSEDASDYVDSSDDGEEFQPNRAGVIRKFKEFDEKKDTSVPMRKKSQAMKKTVSSPFFPKAVSRIKYSPSAKTLLDLNAESEESASMDLILPPAEVMEKPIEENLSAPRPIFEDKNSVLDSARSPVRLDDDEDDDDYAPPQVNVSDLLGEYGSDDDDQNFLTLMRVTSSQNRPNTPKKVPSPQRKLASPRRIRSAKERILSASSRAKSVVNAADDATEEWEDTSNSDFGFSSDEEIARDGVYLAQANISPHGKQGKQLKGQSVKKAKVLRKVVRVTENSPKTVTIESTPPILYTHSAGGASFALETKEKEEPKQSIVASSSIRPTSTTVPTPPIQDFDSTAPSHPESRKSSREKISELRRLSAGLMSFPSPESDSGDSSSSDYEIIRRPSKLVAPGPNPIIETPQITKLPKLTSQASTNKVKDDGLDVARKQREEEHKKFMVERAQMRAAKIQQRSASPAKPSSASKSTKDVNRPQSAKTSTQSSPAPRVIPPIRKPLSNRQLIKNALLHVCLAGSVHERVKQEVLEDLEASPGSHFIILLRGSKNHAFRGLYSYDPALNQVLKVYAPPAVVDEHTGQIVSAPYSGPDSLTETDVLEFFKYDSGTRSFKILPTKSFGMSVSAVSIHSDFGRKVTQKVESLY